MSKYHSPFYLIAHIIPDSTSHRKRNLYGFHITVCDKRSLRDEKRIVWNLTAEVQKQIVIHGPRSNTIPLLNCIKIIVGLEKQPDLNTCQAEHRFQIT